MGKWSTRIRPNAGAIASAMVMLGILLAPYLLHRITLKDRRRRAWSSRSWQYNACPARLYSAHLAVRHYAADHEGVLPGHLLQALPYMNVSMVLHHHHLDCYYAPCPKHGTLSVGLRYLPWRDWFPRDSVVLVCEPENHRKTAFAHWAFAYRIEFTRLELPEREFRREMARCLRNIVACPQWQSLSEADRDRIEAFYTSDGEDEPKLYDLAEDVLPILIEAAETPLGRQGSTSWHDDVVGGIVAVGCDLARADRRDEASKVVRWLREFAAEHPTGAIAEGREEVERGVKEIERAIAQRAERKEEHSR